jgi:large subunit ribosomal protein L18
MAFEKNIRRIKIRRRIRGSISGTETKPRLSVFRSNKQIYAQIIDDVNGKTIVAASSAKLAEKVTKVETAAIVGKMIAEKALSAGIKQVVFDRSGYLYHGRIKSLAEGAREGGLIF